MARVGGMPARVWHAGVHTDKGLASSLPGPRSDVTARSLTYICHVGFEMILVAGAKVGSYEVLAPIGSGRNGRSVLGLETPG